MRLLLASGCVAVVAVGLSLPAQAQNYPWCAIYGGDMGDSQNCGFISFEQCMETVRGIGGFCDRNTQYIPPPGVSGRRARRKQYPS